MTPYDDMSPQGRTPLIDGFGRTVSYLRVSVTDRCDLRCVYCMAEHMTFLPKAEVLTLEELDRIATAFVGLGTRKLRLTGGEPLMRKGMLELVRHLGRHLQTGALDELTLSTNGTRLREFAGDLADAGVRRVNVSMDTLNPDLFRRLTRGGVLPGAGGHRARRPRQALQVKINTVALAATTPDPGAGRWAHGAAWT